MKVLLGAMSVALALTAAQGSGQTASAPVPAHNANVYRVTYTLTETDAGKRVGVQHYSVVVAEGARTVLKNGSKIPVATGSYGPSGQGSTEGVQTQFTYLDIGINIDTTLSPPVDGMWTLKAKVEQSSVAEDKLISGVNEPIVRQSVLEASTTLTPGKPQMLGTLDFSGSTRHLEIEVMMEPVK
jgi:type II secretory pathway component GspD/PulD (secretin)